MEGMPYPPSQLSHSQPDLRRNQEKDSGLKQLLFSSQNEAPREAGLGLAQVNVGNGLRSWQGAPGPRQLAPGRKRAWPVWSGRCESWRRVRCGDRQEDFGVRHPHSGSASSWSRAAEGRLPAAPPTMDEGGSQEPPVTGLFPERAEPPVRAELPPLLFPAFRIKASLRSSQVKVCLCLLAMWARPNSRHL